MLTLALSPQVNEYFLGEEAARFAVVPILTLTYSSPSANPNPNPNPNPDPGTEPEPEPEPDPSPNPDPNPNQVSFADNATTRVPWFSSLARCLG